MLIGLRRVETVITAQQLARIAAVADAAGARDPFLPLLEATQAVLSAAADEAAALSGR